MKKIVVEIITMIIAYVILSVYGYFNSEAKGWSWLISAIIVLIIFAVIKISEYRKK